MCTQSHTGVPCFVPDWMEQFDPQRLGLKWYLQGERNLENVWQQSHPLSSSDTRKGVL